MPDFEAQWATLRDNQEVAVCRVKGAMDTATILNFQNALYRLRSQGIKRLVLDMEEISYVNSTGFSVMLKHAELFKNDAGELVIANMHPKIKLVYEVLGLAPYVRIFDNVDDATSALLESAPGEPVSSPAPEDSEPADG